jgi:DTW domain-containing protein YfiP
MVVERQRKTKEPCSGCFLHLDLCICSQIETLDLKTKLTLIVHYKELKKTTNTGRLAIKSLLNSQMRIRGEIGKPSDLSELISDQYQCLLFYPSKEAVELNCDFVAKFSKPIHLLVPDGSWRQASKVHTRHPELSSVPRVMIKDLNLATQHLRRESSQEGMSTLEAIAKAMRVIEGEEVFEVLFKIYKAKLRNTLIGRGRKRELV